MQSRDLVKVRVSGGECVMNVGGDVKSGIASLKKAVVKDTVMVIVVMRREGG